MLPRSTGNQTQTNSVIPRTFGNYIIERELDRGGAAVVFLAQHKTLPRKVAIKVLRNQEEDTVERFRREAELTSQLKHPHIVEIYDHGMQGPFPYTVMEAALGGSLKRKLETAKKFQLGLDQALWIVREIGSALDFAHAKGTIHRDVSPGNILFDEDGKRTLLTDFGIARNPKVQSNTTMRVVMGTPGYFSPEHLRSVRDVTAQSDIFGLGVIFYAMLAGKVPWEDVPPTDPDNPKPFKPLSQIIAVPATLDPIMQTWLAINPDNRYKKVSDIITDLQRVFPDHPILADPKAPPPVRRQSIYLTPQFQPKPLMQNPVEQVLGPNLIRDVITRAHKRADILNQPEHLVNVLQTWSYDDRWRQRNLGRLATFHEIESQNVYFYTLTVLIETRGDPFSWEQPDRERKPMSGAMEVGVWDMKLPMPEKFDVDQGTVKEITGSEQVSQCSKCSGKTTIVCDTCKGNGRITVTKTVEKPVEITDDKGNKVKSTTTVVENEVKPCTGCAGKGYLTCPQCEGVGMVIKRKSFKWERKPLSFEGHTDLPNVDENALRAEAQEVYNQTQATIPKEWRKIPEVEPLIKKAEEEKGKIVLARLQVELVPVTKVQFELDRDATQDEQVVSLVDDDADDDTPEVPVVQADNKNAVLHTVHLLGFDNHISASEANKFRDWRRILNLAAIGFLVLLVVIMLIFVFVVY